MRMCVSNTPQIRNLICVTFTSVINFRRMILISVYFNYSTADHRQESINHPKTHVNGRPQQFQCQVVNTTATAARRHCNPQRIRNGTSFRAGPGNIGQGRRSRGTTNILSSFHVVLSRNSSSSSSTTALIILWLWLRNRFRSTTPTNHSFIISTHSGHCL